MINVNWKDSRKRASRILVLLGLQIKFSERLGNLDDARSFGWKHHIIELKASLHFFLSVTSLIDIFVCICCHFQGSLSCD